MCKYKNFVIPRTDTQHLKKGVEYPIVSYLSNSLYISVQGENDTIVQHIKIDSPDFLVVFNGRRTDTITVKENLL